MKYLVGITANTGSAGYARQVGMMIRLLYIDDNIEACRIVAAFCDRCGAFTVRLLGSGEAALEWLSCSAADVIVSDYTMTGGMDGITLLKRLRSSGCTTPFILFSAEDSPEIRENAYRNGASRFISKSPKTGSPLYQLFRAIYWAAGREVPKNEGA